MSSTSGTFNIYYYWSFVFLKMTWLLISMTTHYPASAPSHSSCQLPMSFHLRCWCFLVIISRSSSLPGASDSYLYVYLLGCSLDTDFNLSISSHFNLPLVLSSMKVNIICLVSKVRNLGVVIHSCLPHSAQSFSH